MILTNEDLEIERRQAWEEGRDLSGVDGEFDELLSRNMSEESSLQSKAVALLEKVQRLPLRENHPFDEPDDLKTILIKRPVVVPEINPPGLSDSELYDKMYGAWLGRCCGCLLGKPVEGRSRLSLERLLRVQHRWPLNHYWSKKIDRRVAVEENWFAAPTAGSTACTVEDIRFMPEDDDLNYTVTGYRLLKEAGPDFTPSQVARFWLQNLPYLRTFTAERAAYRNLIRMIPPLMPNEEAQPPYTCATWCNPFREWIGAQIRGDFFGYASPGRPDRAAKWAWRDACISHVKNGIYGEMWVAAMLAAAWTTDDLETIILAGLAQIPAKCRLRQEIEKVMEWKKSGMTFDQAANEIHEEWNELDPHDWCHTISNAAVVAVGLLWGDLSFEGSICRAVTCAFDTDCNGATVGSLVGLILGARNLPKRWVKPLRDTLQVGITGMESVRISELAKGSCGLVSDLSHCD